MQILKTIPAFLKESRTELRRVNWPTRKETVKFTLIVIGMSAVMAALLGAFDFVYVQILNRFIF